MLTFIGPRRRGIDCCQPGTLHASHRRLSANAAKWNLGRRRTLGRKPRGEVWVMPAEFPCALGDAYGIAEATADYPIRSPRGPIRARFTGWPNHGLPFVVRYSVGLPRSAKGSDSEARQANIVILPSWRRCLAGVQKSIKCHVFTQDTYSHRLSENRTIRNSHPETSLAAAFGSHHWQDRHYRNAVDCDGREFRLCDKPSCLCGKLR